MERYSYLSGYKRASRARRDVLKRLIGKDSRTEFRYVVNKCYCSTDPTDSRGRKIIPKNIRLKNQYKAYEVYDKKY